MAYNPQALRQVTQKEAQTLGLPESYKQYTAFPFAGVNQKDDQRAMEDVEFYWLENILRTGDGFLRSAPGESASAFYTNLSKTIIYSAFYDIGETSYVVAFFSDGTAIQINVDTAATTTITSVSGEFYDSNSPDNLPSCVQWGTKYLLISNNNTSNDYWIWDGSVLFTRGTLGPEPVLTGTGAGYNGTQPTMTEFGGHGDGTATFEATINGGAVIQLKVTAPGAGYLPGEVVGVSFDAGGCPDEGAILTANLVSTTVSSAEIVDGGYGYTAATVAFTGGGGAGATGTVTVTSGRCTSITITNVGASYETAPTATISGDGVGAKAAAHLLPVALNTVTVTDGGDGYWLPPTAALSGPDGTGATIRTKLTATTIDTINVVDHGEGYQADPTIIVLNLNSGGINGAATADANNGVILNLTVTNAGSGYTLPPLVYDDGTTGNLLPTSLGFQSHRATYEARLTPTTIGTVIVGNSGNGYTTAPTIIIDPGFNNAAYATCEVMPFGVSGGAIETFQSRVWTVFPKEKFNTGAHTDGTLITSDPSSVVSFLTITPNDGSVLRSRYTGIKQSNGYLYIFGDSSISIVSNVQTAGDPSVTTFSFQNVEPQVGTIYRDTIQALGRSLYFANKNGVFRLSGGAVTRVSESINNIFETALFPDSTPVAGVLPTAGVVYINNIRYYVLQLTIIDPFTDAARKVMLAYDETAWYVLSQETTTYNAIFTRVVEGDLRLYGRTDHTIVRLFSTDSSTLEKVVVTKLFGADTFGFLKLIQNVMLEGEDMSSDSSGVAIDIVVNTELPSPAASVTLDFQADLSDTRVFTANGGDVRGRFLGLTLGSTSKDFSIKNIAIGYTLDAGPIGADQSTAPPVE